MATKELSFAMQDFLVRAAREPEGRVTTYGWGCGFFNQNTAHALRSRGLLEFGEQPERRGGQSGTAFILTDKGRAEAAAIVERRSAEARP